MFNLKVSEKIAPPAYPEFDKSFYYLLKCLKQDRQKKQGAIPWYFVMGDKESGKSSLLQNSNQSFPFLLNPENTSVEGKNWLSEESAFLEMNVQDEVFLSHVGHLIQKNHLASKMSGIIITLSIEELLTKTPDIQRQNGFQLQIKIRQLQTLLGKILPIHIIITKIDLLTGFNEFFSLIKPIEKKNVLGMTLNYSQKSSIDYEKIFNEQFHQWIKDINQWGLDKSFQENSSLKVSLMTGFPLQLILLKEKIQWQLSAFFNTTRFHEPLQLRGIYFTSAEQKNSASIDPLLGYLAPQFSLLESVKTNFQTSENPQSYFIEKLLKNLILKDAHSNLPTPEYSGHQKKYRKIYYSVVTFLFLGVISLHAYGYLENQKAIRDLKQALTHYQQESHFEPKLPALQHLENTRQAIITPSEWQLKYLGFHQALNLSHEVNHFYQVTLASILWPWITADVESEILNTLNQPKNLYNNLKMYLMLGYPQYFNREFVSAYLKNYWSVRYPQAIQTQSTLQYFLNIILQLSPKAIPIDTQLIEKARSILKQSTDADRIYADIKEKASHKNFEPIVFKQDIIFNIQNNNTLIPGFFSKKAYYNNLLQLKNEVSQFRKEDWVVKDNTNLNTLKQVQTLYQKEYNQLWMNSLKSLSFNINNSLPDLVNFLKTLSTKDNSLQKVIKVTQDNTNLLSGIDPVFSNVDYQKIQQTLIQVYQFVLPFSGTAESSANAYRTFTSMVNTGQTTPLTTLQNESLQSPEPLKTWLNTLVVQIYQSLGNSALQYANKDWQSNVYNNYAEAIANKYPINHYSDSEIALADFTRFFATNGVLDQFYQSHQSVLPLSQKALKNKESLGLIQQAFFDNGGSTLHTSFTIKAINLDPHIVSAELSMGDQTILYRHDPQLPTTLNWPLTANNGNIKLTLTDESGKQYQLTETGSWGLFRLFDQCKLSPESKTAFDLTCSVSNHNITYHIEASSVNNPLSIRSLLQHFNLSQNL
jgi:type VI secretion system protein ImpL